MLSAQRRSQACAWRSYLNSPIPPNRKQFSPSRGLPDRCCRMWWEVKMTDGSMAFVQFKRLAAGLRDWGYDVRDDGEFGEFALGGFVCSYRNFGVLDITFLRPGELLSAKPEPDMVWIWNGTAWEEPTEWVASPRTLSTSEVYRTCVRTVNFMAGSAIGIGASYCVVPTPGPAAHA
jgi:hypothetical protein